jgi:hypothetical protein
MLTDTYLSSSDIPFQSQSPGITTTFKSNILKKRNLDFSFNDLMKELQFYHSRVSRFAGCCYCIFREP